MFFFLLGYDGFLPVSEFIPKDKIKDINDVRLWLKIDGEQKQDGKTSDIIFK